MEGICERKKRYVPVILRADEDGTMHPMAVLWWNGRLYAFDEVSKPRRQAARRVGGDGLCYTVTIGNYTTNLYYEDPRWFVEEKVYE